MVLASLLTASLTFVVFAPTLRHGFVNWDDDVYVTLNPMLRPLTAEHVVWIATHFYYYAFIPVTLLSHAADVALWGLNPWGHHLTNVLLHAWNAVLVLWLGLLLVRSARKATGRNEPGRGVDAADVAGMTLAALLFALHPLRAESVSWISDRKDLLCTFFLLPSLGAYLMGADARGRAARGWYAASWALFALAALSKTVAIGFPLLLILFDVLWLRRWKGPRGGARLLLEKIPFLLLSAGLIGASLMQSPDARRSYAVSELRGIETLLFPFHVLAFSWSKTFAPFGLSPIYPRVGMDTMTIALLLLLATAAACALALKRGHATPVLVGASYLLFLVPNVVGLSSGMQPVADRYSYLSTVGIFLGIGGALAVAWRRGRATRALAVVLVTALLVALSLRTLAQNDRWSSSIRLWESVVRSEPPRRDYVDAYVNLGEAYAAAGRGAEARAILARAVALDPSNAGALYNLGVLEYAAGGRERAASLFRRATEANPSDARAFFNLAIVLDQLGRRAEAVDAMKEAARLGYPEAREALERSP